MAWGGGLEEMVVGEEEFEEAVRVAEWAWQRLLTIRERGAREE